MYRREALLAASLLALPRPSHADEDGDLARQASREDGVARWLAGMAHPVGAPFAPTNEWLSYAAAEDARWSRSASRIRTMRSWSKRELASLVGPGRPARPLLYPFGGPDALHALALFEDVQHVFLIGLEPPRPLPDWAHPMAPGYFDDLGTAMSDIHRLTFFRTHELQTDMADVGVVPPLLATLVRMGGRIQRVSMPSESGASSAPLVSIDWVSSDGLPRRLDYAQLDLSNGSLSGRTEMVALLRGLAPHVTFLKAASYLPAEPRFSYFRALVQGGSLGLVQDDTGIPFHDLEGRWATRFFGRYVPPGSPFEDRAQPDLENAFTRQPSSPLPFGIGYHIQPRDSNLLLATPLR